MNKPKFSEPLYRIIFCLRYCHVNSNTVNNALKILDMIQNTDETSATKCFETINKIKRGDFK